jgi:hypothetical protein
VARLFVRDAPYLGDLMDAATAAPYVAAGVALAIGILTPWRSNRSASKRQREQLDDAAQRQREQLDYDRAMRRRDELIALIGDAASAGSTRFYLTERARDLWQQGVGWDDPQAQEIDRDRVAAVEKLRDAWGRMEIRFPQDSAVRQRFEEWRTELDRYSNLVRWGYRTGLPFVPEMMKVEERHRLATEAADRWLAAARAAVAALERGEAPAEVEVV